MGLAILYVTICYLCFLGGILLEKHYLSKKNLKAEFEKEFPEFEFDLVPEPPEDLMTPENFMNDENYQNYQKQLKLKKHIKWAAFRVYKCNFLLLKNHSIYSIDQIQYLGESINLYLDEIDKLKIELKKLQDEIKFS